MGAMLFDQITQNRIAPEGAPTKNPDISCRPSPW